MLCTSLVVNLGRKPEFSPHIHFKLGFSWRV